MQELTIENFHPANFQSAGHGGRGAQWRASREKKDAWKHARDAATAAGWKPVIGKALIDVTYVYKANYRVDVDNLIHRLKGFLDGIKTIPTGKYQQSGWIEDDDTEHLDIRVHKLVERGRKALVVKLYGQITNSVEESTECSLLKPLIRRAGLQIQASIADSVWTKRQARTCHRCRK